jgi:hypothetical protein
VAAVLVALALARLRRAPRAAVVVMAALAIQGVAYLVGHRLIYGGWTAYAAGDHFVQTGEFSVVGVHPDYVGRSRRLVGLLVDREFGLAAWAPAWLLLPAAIGAFVRRRPPGWLVVGLTALAGWLVATFVALTMHGWWWPGRQVVVIVPLLVVLLAWWVAHVPWARVALVVGAVLGTFSWLWTEVEAITRRHTLVVDFMNTSNPWYRAWRHVLPDGRSPTTADNVLTVVWLVALVAIGVVAAGIPVRGWSRLARGSGEHDGASVGDDHGVLELRGEAAVGGAQRPPVVAFDGVGRARREERLDRENESLP